jgi:hypothetical protein
MAEPGHRQKEAQTENAAVQTPAALKGGICEVLGRADWSDAFALVPSLKVPYVWHADSETTRSKRVRGDGGVAMPSVRLKRSCEAALVVPSGVLSAGIDFTGQTPALPSRAPIPFSVGPL